MYILTERPIFGAGVTHAAQAPGKMEGEMGGLRQINLITKFRTLGNGGTVTGSETLGGIRLSLNSIPSCVDLVLAEFTATRKISRLWSRSC